MSKSKKQFEPPRYVLLARDGDGKRVALCSTPRSLLEMAGLLKSLFALNPAATVIDVVLVGWPKGEKVDDQEVLLQAERYCGDGPGTFIWYKVRDLRAIELDIEARASVLADAEMEVAR